MKENKKVYISMSTILILILVVVVGVMGYWIYKLSNDKVELQDAISILKQEIFNIRQENTENINVDEQKDSENKDIDEKEVRQVLEKYLELCSINDDGTPLLCSYDSTKQYGLGLYNNYEEMSEDLVESDEYILTADNQKITLYKTSISFWNYKDTMLQYVSEELFEKQFTTYHRNVDGLLYVINQPTAGESYVIESMEKIPNNDYVCAYKVEYKHSVGENPYVNGDLEVMFDINKDGNYIVADCIFNESV